ncbi:aroma-sacti cluster domain-containing protein [Kitasatospora sp. NPDC048540]|uniref:aroma-sacti cluster domain-containing protein n=1 Tax=unclassified Kitasatospora TaxID=2633591 RepID=UPI00053A193F|nr:aroma-sacti cluster domain-containing protein [Kitasatospora sp. MBT63]
MADPHRLTELGFDLDYASDEQLAVLDALTEEEIQLLLDVKRRLDAAGADVEGHGIEGGALLW